MTLLPDIEATNVACCGGGDASSSSSVSEHGQHGPTYPAGQSKASVINCCTSAASSKMSIDETSSTASVAAKVNNLNYDNEAFNHDNFSQCDPVYIEFSDVRYKVRKFSVPERKFGKLLKPQTQIQWESPTDVLSQLQRKSFMVCMEIFDLVSWQLSWAHPGPERVRCSMWCQDSGKFRRKTKTFFDSR